MRCIGEGEEGLAAVEGITEDVGVLAFIGEE